MPCRRRLAGRDDLAEAVATGRYAILPAHLIDRVAGSTRSSAVALAECLRRGAAVSRLRVLFVAAVTLAVSNASFQPTEAAGAVTERVDVSGREAQAIAGVGFSYPAVSGDGRYVAFTSNADNLVPGDTANSDVFVRDRVAGTTTLVSRSSTGEKADSVSGLPAMTPDARYVAFISFATNLVPRDTNGNDDVFVRDRVTGTTRRISVSSAGFQSNGVAENAMSPAISADGRYLVFWSDATNLVPGDTNGIPDLFIRDTQRGTTTLVNVSSRGEQANGYSWIGPNAVSADGRYVAFTSDASNLARGDTNNAEDVFVRDIKKSTTTRVSLSGNESQGDAGSSGGAVSASGRYVAFTSGASNLTPASQWGDLLVRDRVTGTTRLVSRRGEGATVSADGRFVAFVSSDGLVPRDSNGAADIYLRDRARRTTTLISVSSHGELGNGDNLFPVISADGCAVAFWSEADNLVPNDTNNVEDIFIRDRGLCPSAGSRGGRG